MLPLLLDQQSAAAVTLSSKQLRRLCQSGQQSLRLGEDSDWQEHAAAAHLSERFPACRKLLVTACSSGDLAFHLPDALDTLSGMTSMSTLVVNVFDAAATSDPSAMVLAVQGVRRLIAGVQQQ
ncbi:hypothetical protein OEZ85_011926 [Tetradesmus obliquus]|uniref:CHAT domain-containing protein n=1 Tax=Tetradesmus obliquus TaxID=3088 RepID=A0ABY8TSJ6_TETOB|nr:hypothetical protein OEZ85_011926 [Tetradesmus obliquus]